MVSERAAPTSSPALSAGTERPTGQPIQRFRASAPGLRLTRHRCESRLMAPSSSGAESTHLISVIDPVRTTEHSLPTACLPMEQGNRLDAATLLSSDDWSRLMSDFRISPRERDILESLMHGADSEAEFAASLQMSPRTVHTHLERLYRKLGVTSRSQLVASLFVAYANICQ